MTTMFGKAIKCTLCGNEHQYILVGSTNAFGSPDLDMRPPEMKRSTMEYWVHRCPSCGYCASDVSEAPPGAKEVIAEELYRRQLNDPAYPELANSFLCKAMIDHECGEYAAATWALIAAAWACDDAVRPTEAAACRKRAAVMLVLAEQKGQRVAEEGGASTAIRVDLLRRSGQAAEALKAIGEGRPGITEALILRILDFEEALIGKSDFGCHTVEDVLNAGR